jgi:hypothetical protein
MTESISTALRADLVPVLPLLKYVDQFYFARDCPVKLELPLKQTNNPFLGPKTWQITFKFAKSLHNKCETYIYTIKTFLTKKKNIYFKCGSLSSKTSSDPPNIGTNLAENIPHCIQH